MRQFLLLYEQYGEEQELHNLRLRYLCATILNSTHFKFEKKKPWSADDFKPEKKNDLLAQVEALNAMLGGVDRRSKGV